MRFNLILKIGFVAKSCDKFEKIKQVRKGEFNVGREDECGRMDSVDAGDKRKGFDVRHSVPRIS